MRRIEAPDIFVDLERVGVVLEYSFFENAKGSRQCDLQGIDAHLADANQPKQWNLPDEKVKALCELQVRRLSREQFLGDWCDHRDLMLIEKGSGEVQGRGRLTDPRYDVLGDSRLKSWGSGFPDLHETGQYAHAFANPPYRLGAGRAEIVRLFRKSTEILLPSWDNVLIDDWSENDLSKVDRYFEAGMEWWGVFLFTIFQPSLSRLIVISGSATD